MRCNCHDQLEEGVVSSWRSGVFEAISQHINNYIVISSIWKANVPTEMRGVLVSIKNDNPM